MSDRKFFNTWVSKNFKGLSAHTLTQFLEKFCGFSKDYCMTIVYEKLFDYAPDKWKKIENIYDITSMDSISQIIKDGVNTVIIGKPNVGKSSLLNGILREKKAIVTNIAGTTRDTVEGRVNLGGIVLNLVDMELT